MLEQFTPIPGFLSPPSFSNSSFGAWNPSCSLTDNTMSLYEFNPDKGQRKRWLKCFSVGLVYHQCVCSELQVWVCKQESNKQCSFLPSICQEGKRTWIIVLVHMLCNREEAGEPLFHKRLIDFRALWSLWVLGVWGKGRVGPHLNPTFRPLTLTFAYVFRISPQERENVGGL